MYIPKWVDGRMGKPTKKEPKIPQPISIGLVVTNFSRAWSREFDENNMNFEKLLLEIKAKGGGNNAVKRKRQRIKDMKLDIFLASTLYPNYNNNKIRSLTFDFVNKTNKK